MIFKADLKRFSLLITGLPFIFHLKKGNLCKGMRNVNFYIISSEPMKNVNYTAAYVQTQSVLQNGNESKIINHFISRLNSASNVQNH